MILAECGGEAQGAAREGFPYAEDVGRDVGVVSGKKSSSPSEARGDLIENQRNPVFLSEIVHAAEEFGRVEPHSTRALHNGFENDRGRLLFMTEEGGLEGRPVGVVARLAEA